MLKAVIYCRKSTDKEDNQVLSLESQRDFCVQLAEREGIEVAEIIEESMSASSPGRPGYARMLKMMSMNEVDIIITWKINRLARNSIDAGSFTWFLQQGVIKKTYTSDGVYTPETNMLLLSVMFGMSQQYSIDLRKDVMRGMGTAVKKGQVIQRAPYGYKYDKNTKSVIESEDAIVVKKIFEWRAKGLSVDEILKELKKIGKKMSDSGVGYILRNSFYYGFMKWKDDYFKGNYEPLVTKEMFDQVNGIPKLWEREEKIGLFPLKGQVKTDGGKVLRASLAKKKYPYYHGHAVNISEDLIFAEFEKILPSLEVNDYFKEVVLQGAIDFEKEGMKNSVEEIDGLTKRKNALLARKENLFDMRISGEIDSELYAQKNKEIHDSVLKIEGELKELEKQNDDLKEKTIKLVELVTGLQKLYFGQDRIGKSQIISDLSVELFAHPDKSLTIKLLPVYEGLIKLNTSFGDPMENRTPIAGMRILCPSR